MIGRSVSFGLLGLLVGLIVASIVSAGTFQRWHALSPTGMTFKDITDTSISYSPGPQVAGVTSNDTELSCAPRSQGVCWGESIQGRAGFPSTKRVCPTSDQLFGLLIGRPTGLVKCLGGSLQYAESTMTYEFALDIGGNVWYRGVETYVYGTIINSLQGAGIGLVCGIVLGLLAPRKKETAWGNV